MSTPTGGAKAFSESPLGKACRVIERCTNAGAAIGSTACIVLSLLIFANVFLRYIFNKPWLHGDEVVRYLTAWTVLWALAYCAKVKGHIRVQLLLDRFQGQKRRWVQSAADLVGMLWIVTLVTGGWMVWWAQWTGKGHGFGLLDIEEWIPGLALVGGLTLFGLQAIVEFVKTASGIKDEPLDLGFMD